MSSEITYPSPIKPQAGFADILRTEETYGQPDGKGVGQQLNGWFDKLMVQSGLEISPATLLMLCFLSGLTLGGALFVWQENLLATAFAAFLGMILPVGLTDIRPCPQAAGNTGPDARDGRRISPRRPHGTQPRTMFATRCRRYSRSLGKRTRTMLCPSHATWHGTAGGLEDLPERTGVISLNVLVTALVVHHQTGGNLVTVLERLQQTIRDRITFLGRLRTATSASRATAMMMLILPPGILAFFIFRDPDYLNHLMQSTWGRYTTITAVILQIVGSLWVVRILQNSQRT